MRPSVPLLSLALSCLAAGDVAAQFVDIQPGRNFPSAAQTFGGGRTGGIDLGDLDLDGDLDVAAANGQFAPQDNGIYINLGGIQGGVEGAFADESAARLVDAAPDRSRDLAFVDYDGDGDLDLFFTNEGNTSNGGGVSRAFRNQGGRELGTVGFYLEDTDRFWGQLVGVPLSSQVLGGNQGPFREFPCDCSFGDLDLDGDPDLFQSSYGPNINGTRESRVFLNDGTGIFDELWPWADPAADVKLHAVDVELMDIDADFDLDVIAASRDSQSRVYRNDLDAATGTWPADPFTDVTQSALLDQGAVQGSSNVYEFELADLDGDGDFDLWANNYSNFKESLLFNDGTGRFQQDPDALKGDPGVDEEEIDVIDFDGDGDLDVFNGNFSGTNYLYQSALAEGLPPGGGLLHRTGTASQGSQAGWPETPASLNGGTTLGVEVGDLDGDGDHDLVLGNDGNQINRIWPNALGVPDTHPPTVQLISTQGDKSDGSDTPLRVQLRDNAPQRVTRGYDVDLVYSVDGGLPVRVPMGSQRSHQFQAVIPGGVGGTILWRVEGADDAGNAFVSATSSFEQTSTGSSPIVAEGSGTPGVAGFPDLLGIGDLTAGSTVSLSLRDGPPSATAFLFLSVASTPAPFKGGFLHTLPLLDAVPLTTDVGGTLWLDAVWPPGLPSGASLWLQFGLADATTLPGATLSNALRLTTP